jgi:hypothetical protein
MPRDTLDGIHISFPDNDAIKVKWAFESLKAIGNYSQIRNRIKEQLQVSNMMKLTRDRLKHHLEMTETHLVYLSEFLKPLGWSSVQDQKYAQYVSNNPEKSMMLVNYDYLFRDWVWGEEENKRAFEKVLNVLPSSFKPKRLLVLGSGAGRLAYDLNEALDLERITLVDINPLLLMASQRIIQGEELEMVEFPYMPASKDYVGIIQKLKAPKAYDHFEFLLADARTHDFSNEDYDMILTPWLIDVIDMDLSDTCEVIKKISNEETKWVNYGPLGFNSDQLRLCYSTEEALHIIKKKGFTFCSQNLETIPYMFSPYSHSRRMENVLTFSSKL